MLISFLGTTITLRTGLPSIKRSTFSFSSAADSQLDLSEASKISRIPTYMPAVLVNLLGQKALGETNNERITKAIEFGLPFIVKFRASLLCSDTYFETDPTPGV